MLNQPSSSSQRQDQIYSHTLGLLIPFSPDIVRSPYLEGVIGSIMEELSSLDCDLQWIMIRDRHLDNFDLELLRRQYPQVEGLIIISWRHFTRLIIQLEQEKNFPVVLINDYDPAVSLSNVFSDSTLGIEQLWDFVKKKNYSKIGVVKGPENVSPDARIRFEIFSSCAKKDGATLSDAYIYEAIRFDDEAGYHTMQLWLKKGDLPDFIFCCNDDLARGSIRALKENKIKIPDDIAIAGFDDSRLNSMTEPTLTSIHQPLEDLGTAAVQILLRLIQKMEQPPVFMKFDTSLAARGST